MRVVSHVLLRAPLLSARVLHDAEAALTQHPLGQAALRLASPTLVDHADPRAAAALRRYARRAAFRPTPMGLLAGVAIARATPGPSRIALGDPAVALAPSWERLADLGRALLDTEEGWRSIRLRCAPSLITDGARAIWIAYGADAAARRVEVELDPALALVLRAAAQWIAAPALAKRIAGRGDRAEARALVLQLVDDGLLHHDAEPPLVGEPPARWARRLAPICPALAELPRFDDRARTIDERLRLADRLLAELPGAGAKRPHVATLLHTSAATPQIDRAALDRAAALAPVLFALAEALAPPRTESALVAGLDGLFAAAGHLVGEGRIDVAAVELGRYGATLGGGVVPAAPGAAIVSRLAGLVVEAARTGASELALDLETLAAELPDLAAPPTFELQLTPGAAQGDRAGEGWLLGVHAPAGASWGRFAAALGEPMNDALAELRDAEAAVDEGALRVDVAYAPSRAVADLCVTPALRIAALAVSSWPEEGAVTPAQCALANDPQTAAHLAPSVDGQPLEISPLHRVRSTTAPPSAYRALLGDRLVRQHAPWALGWGPLARSPWLPRVRLDGFVIAPQSWALPPKLDDPGLAVWRSTARPPRVIQVGAEDALLPLDLDDPRDRATLLALPLAERLRAWEIWPPLGQELDEGGRRVELVCAVVGEADGRAARVASLGACRPPDEARARAWRTVKLFAPRDRHAELLARLRPFVQRREVRGWFVLPYLDPPGARPHLRVRLRGKDEHAADRLAEALRDAMVEHVAAIELGAYFREHARYGRDIERVERIFQSDSTLVVALRAADTSGLPDEVLLAVGFDALARGLGLSHTEQASRCADALAAYAIGVEEEREQLAPAYRAVQRELAALLSAPPPPFVAHLATVRAARFSRARASALLPALAHLAAVRLCGPDRDAEVRALYLWSRALESRGARAKAGRPPRRSRSRASR